MKILFICRGNVGRSQMAAALFSKMAPGHEVSSAGTRVVEEKRFLADASLTRRNDLKTLTSPLMADRDSFKISRDGQKLGDLLGAHHVIECLLEEEMDVRENIRRQLTPAIVQGANKIIVMAEPTTIPRYLKDSPKVIYWDVLDPKGTDLKAHRATRNTIRGLVTELIHSL